MRILREGANGADVSAWQTFLHSQALFAGPVSGVFDAATTAATKQFQAKHGLEDDGVAGKDTFGQARLLGFVVPDAPTGTTGPDWPPRPADLSPLITDAQRAAVFGKFNFVHEPVAGNPENIRILPTWVADNIVLITIPQLRGVEGAGAQGRAQCHRLVKDQMLALWADWEAAGLLGLVRTWAGMFVPRFQRKSTTALSNHAFGSAFDINAAWNPLGDPPALVGETGSVRELVPLANKHGFYWGGHFNSRQDGMHFEVARVGGS